MAKTPTRSWHELSWSDGKSTGDHCEDDARSILGSNQALCNFPSSRCRPGPVRFEGGLLTLAVRMRHDDGCLSPAAVAEIESAWGHLMQVLGYEQAVVSRAT